jgi:hypothetical protein
LGQPTAGPAEEYFAGTQATSAGKLESSPQLRPLHIFRWQTGVYRWAETLGKGLQKLLFFLREETK